MPLTIVQDPSAARAIDCWGIMWACMRACETDPEITKVGRFFCKRGCEFAYLECLKARAVLNVVRRTFDTAGAFHDWARQNPGLVILGAVVVIGGVTFIVVASGGTGAVALAPLVAL